MMCFVYSTQTMVYEAPALPGLYPDCMLCVCCMYQQDTLERLESNVQQAAALSACLIPQDKEKSNFFGLCRAAVPTRLL